MKRYKFLRLVGNKIKSANGDCEWELGVWKKEKELDMCNLGFHCSKEIYQAFSYVQSEILAEVEVKGKHDSEDDKEVWSDMRLIKLWKWQKKDSVALSIFAAELCLENFEKIYPEDKRPREAIEAAKKWLKNPTKKNESAAWSAKSAAWSAKSVAEAAWSAKSAAWSAKSAAWSAKSAAEAAWSAKSAAEAAGSAAEAAWSAKSAAWSAKSAAEAAGSAKSAAEAAGSAAGSAEAADLIKKISKWMSDRKLDNY